jgi:hypothetical protein
MEGSGYESEKNYGYISGMLTDLTDQEHCW